MFYPPRGKVDNVKSVPNVLLSLSIDIKFLKILMQLLIAVTCATKGSMRNEHNTGTSLNT